jgi:hypothetical protein
MSQNLVIGARKASVVTGTDTYVATARGFYCGTSGDLTCLMEDGTSVQFVGLAAGVVHPIRFTKITAFSGADGLALF